LTLTTLKSNSRVFLKDTIVSPATEGRRIIQSDLVIVLNQSVDEVVTLLVGCGVPELLGKLYQETTKDASERTDYSYGGSSTTLGIDPYIITGARVKFTTDGAFVNCRPLNRETFLQTVGTQENPNYSLFSISGVQYIQFSPTLKSVSNGLKVYSVEQPTAMVDSTQEVCSLPTCLHGAVVWEAVSEIEDTAGNKEQADIFSTRMYKRFDSLTQGAFSIGLNRLIKSKKAGD
jgi:hypothetical protein